MQSTLDLAEEQARKAGATAITRVGLRLGVVSGVVPEAMEFAFDILKRDTMAKDASLEMECVPGEFRCSACDARILLREARFICPECQGLLMIGGGGMEMELSHLEIV